jgi:CP family cyanate transporter-like MFS transporter
MDAQPAEGSTLQGHATTGALAVTAIVLVAINLRPGIVSVGPLLPSIIDDFHLSHTAASLLVSIPNILMGAGIAYSLARRAFRAGRRDTCCAVGSFRLDHPARVFDDDCGTPRHNCWRRHRYRNRRSSSSEDSSRRAFRRAPPSFMGLYATSLSLGSTISAALTGPVATQTSGGWRWAAGLWGCLGIFAMGSWLIVTTAERRVPQPANAIPNYRLPLRNRTAWLIAVSFACINFLFYGLLSWSVPMYREAGLSPTVAGLALATFTAVFMLANPFFGWISKSRDRRGWLAFCATLGGIGLVSIAFAPATIPFAAIACCAFGLGGAFTLGMTLPLDNTDSVQEANVSNAFVLTVAYLIAAAGPLIVGYLRDLNGNFSPSFILLAAVAALMLSATPFLHPHRRQS